MAAISLFPSDRQPSETAERLLEASDEQIADILNKAWCYFTIFRPELAFRCGPLGRWLNEEPRNEATVAGAAAAIRAAVEAGLLEIALDCDRAREVDVLGNLNLTLKSKEAKKPQGEFYTPGHVAEATAGMGLGTLEPGKMICDPWAGTGGMLRAAASALREQGRDPSEYRWLACDIDPVAVAALAVNVHIWDLGPHVVIACADSIRELDWHQRATDEQRQAAALQWGRELSAVVLGEISRD